MFAIAEKHDIASYAEDIHYSGSQDTENVTLRNYQKFFFSDIFSAKWQVLLISTTPRSQPVEKLLWMFKI